LIVNSAKIFGMIKVEENGGMQNGKLSAAAKDNGIH